MSTAPSDGYLAHIEEYLGPLAGGLPADVVGPDRGFAIGVHRSGDGELVSAVSTGLRFQKLVSLFPQELVCTLYADQETEATYLVLSTGQLAISLGEGVRFDQVIPADNPLIPATEIYGVIATSHPYLDDDDFETMPDADGKPQLVVLTLVPVTRAEIELVEREGPDALYERWEEQETDLLDVHREG